MTRRGWRPRIASAAGVLLLLCALLALVRAEPIDQRKPAPVSNVLFDRIWRGAEQAEKQRRNGCGTLTETRTSRMLARPLVLRGTFCVEGTVAFRLEYLEPYPMLVIYNAGAVNVSTDDGRNIEAFDIGPAVTRVQDYFGGPRARENVERDFEIEALESGDRYTLRLSPVSGRIARGVTRVVVELGRTGFLPSRIEIQGKSGVTSVFDVRFETLNGTLSPSLFDVYRIKPKDPERKKKTPSGSSGF